MQAKTVVDYLINFVMQISHGVYLTAPFVKTDLILIFPGRLKRMLLPVLASEGLGVAELIFQAPGKQLRKENNTQKHKHNNDRLYLAAVYIYNCSLFFKPSATKRSDFLAITWCL